VGWSLCAEYIETAGEDHSQELEEVERAIADWKARALTSGASAESILHILDGLNARR
jgi:hypothetical protein